MKKTSMLATILALVCLFGSCKKDGVYNPGDKISALYHYSCRYHQELDNWGHYFATDSTISPKRVLEKWNWNGNKLQNIEYYDNSNQKATASYKMNFEYDGNRLIKVTKSGIATSKFRIEFEYDGDRIDKMNIFEGGSLTQTIAFSFDGKKLQKVTWTMDGDKKSDPANCEVIDNLVWRNLIPGIGQSARLMEKMTRNAKSAKGERTYTFEYEWKGDNISHLTQHFGDQSETFKFTYDNKTNPFQRFLPLSYSGFSTASSNTEGYTPAVDLCSKNNITSIKTADFSQYYSYTYSKDLPTSRAEQVINNYGTSRDITSVIIYYDYL